MNVVLKEKKERDKFLLQLGEHLRKKRLSKGISAGELSRRCFMDKPNLFRIEKGRMNPSIYILHKLADALEITLEELLRGFKPHS